MTRAVENPGPRTRADSFKLVYHHDSTGEIPVIVTRVRKQVRAGQLGLCAISRLRGGARGRRATGSLPYASGARGMPRVCVDGIRTIGQASREDRTLAILAMPDHTGVPVCQPPRRLRVPGPAKGPGAPGVTRRIREKGRWPLPMVDSGALAASQPAAPYGPRPLCTAPIESSIYRCQCERRPADPRRPYAARSGQVRSGILPG
jgi:hypothetical protein